MKIMKNRKKSKAFTLIELVAVIIILGITLLVAVPMVTRAVRKSKLELMASQENTLKLIGKDYFLSNREALPKEIGEASSVSIKTLIKEGYTKEVKDYNKEICDSNASYVEAIKLEKGKYNYHTYLECKNYTTGDIWSEWSSWSDEEPIGGKDMEIETATFYNYEEALDYWSDWSDWEEVSDNGKIVPINEIIDTESQYRYRDQQWKWNNGGGREYASGYYVSAPAGYPFQDSNQTSWEETWHNGSATGSSTRQVQYKNKVEYPTSSYYTYDETPDGYPSRDSWDGTISGWIYKYYSEGNNGYSYTYDSKRTGALSTRTRSRTWGDWITISSGSVTPSTTRQVQFRDKKYRYSRYKYTGRFYKNITEDEYNPGENILFRTESFYYYNYYSSPSSSQCNSICSYNGDCPYYCPIYPCKVTCSYSSRSDKYGDYNRNENNVTGDTISTSYGRKSWTIDGTGQWYAWQSYSSTLSYDPNKKEVQYRDLNKYTAYSGWAAQSSGTHVVNDLKDIMYK
ncbi:MAG: type II secretion system protein, partial [Bacilli bacterium]